MSRSGSDSDNFDEEQEVGRFTIKPYQFEPRVDSDEAESHSEGDQLSDDDETAKFRLVCNDHVHFRFVM